MISPSILEYRGLEKEKSKNKDQIIQNKLAIIQMN
jgi:hypothetical protein